MSRAGAVPVVMYHRVGPEIEDWSWSNSLTVSVSTFEDHLRWLARSRYYTASLEELHRHMKGEDTLPKRSVVLTFDDGYADNWSYVMPMLQKHGFKCVIAVTTEFVDPDDVVRPTMKDVWEGRLPESDLDVRAFMTWTELREGCERGVFSLASHSRTHTWFPKGPRVVDFHHPGDAHFWLDWNDRPKEKPYYLRHCKESRVPWGTPIYEHARALQMTRYHPDPDEVANVTDFVRDHGGADFFMRPDWRDALHELVRRRREATTLNDRYENAKERDTRYQSELIEAKDIIEKNTGYAVRQLIWPGQVFSAEAMALARTVYDSVDSSLGESSYDSFNQAGDDPGLFRRFGVPDIEMPGRLYYPGGRYLVGCLDEFRGMPMARKVRQALKLSILAKLKAGLGPAPT